MVKPFIFQISGYQNSGKTTLVSELISFLRQSGYDAAAIKHHGHGGEPDRLEGKDSSAFYGAGAAVSIVEGQGSVELHGRLPEKKRSLDDMIQLASFFEPDVLLVEGFKKEAYPKAVIIREEKDLELVNKLSQIQAVLFWPAMEKRVQSLHTGLPFFSIKTKDFHHWLLSLIQEEE
ncbi:molybdopterin-guanine dinucleotide biosynthesis protein B [Bacillus massiliglaciei]|uniref:molybdopterin-guanine dinucleotide biosynthesis protein B n=1 Tax=Bacillus massiliglaciei TaxID=1816693 RepID=UPI000AF92882|nr:molybdopterin-guanine dinucleotide biosynthesis protein B [Bacillus massiliglaciei]